MPRTFGPLPQSNIVATLSDIFEYDDDVHLFDTRFGFD